MAEMPKEVRKMQIKAEKEYPSLDGITEDYKTLRVISPAYAGGRGELTAVLQYVYPISRSFWSGSEKRR